MIIVSCAIVYRWWLPKAFVSRCGSILSSHRWHRTTVSQLSRNFGSRILIWACTENFTSLAICIFRICIYPVIWVTFCCLLTVASKINQAHAYSTSFQTAFPRKLRFQGNLLVVLLSRFRIRNLLLILISRNFNRARDWSSRRDWSRKGSKGAFVYPSRLFTSRLLVTV